jgi:hypothetical protein
MTKNVLIAFAILLMVSCAPKENAQDDVKPLSWYKGNTHVHTTLCGHADTQPDTVAAWYLDRGYNFLILSEHNQFIDPATVNLPSGRRDDFILIPGEEVTDFAAIHTTAMNISRLVKAQRQETDEMPVFNTEEYANAKVYLMQKHTDSIKGAGGIPILNHPNFVSGAAASYIQDVNGLDMLELHNGHPDVYNWGNDKHASMEQKWDSLLSAGRRVYGVSSDDAHSFKKWAPDVSNPGRGWVMVQSESLTPDAVTAAMEQGKFYSSSGVMLAEITLEDELYSVVVDEANTYKEIESPFVIGYKLQDNAEGFIIEFVSENGEVLQRSEGLSASFPFNKASTYLRAKITYSRNRGNDSEQFFAWTQPVFLP